MSKIISNENGFTTSVDHHLGRVTLNNLKKWKEAIHQVELSSDEVNTHEEVRLRSVRVAGGLQSRGLGVGDVIVICGNTHNHICLPILASFYLGCAYFPISPKTSMTELKRMLEQGTPKIIFCDPCMEEIFTRALQELNIHVEIVIFGDVHRDSDTTLTHITPFSEFLKPTGTEDNFEVTDFDPNTTIAAIIFSSGSTGLPKGVCLTHSTLSIRHHHFIGSEYKYTGTGFLMSFTNHFWISATVFLLNTCLAGTPRIICASPFSMELLNKGLNKYKPETLFLNTVYLYNVVKNASFEEMDFSSVKSFVSGGCSISDDVISAITAKLINGDLFNAYAGTETGSIAVNKNEKTGSMGKALPWVHWKVIDTNTGKKAKCGEQGELYFKTESIFTCYLNDPKGTQDALDEDGYFKTGDLVSYDEDGYLYFVDRVKEIIYYKNYQVSPTEIEVEIRKLPDVLQVCVVGKKHEEDGERPMAFIQKREGSNLTEQDIKDAVKNSLEDYKQLSGGVVFLDKLPETGSGKINRIYLKYIA